MRILFSCILFIVATLGYAEEYVEINGIKVGMPISEIENFHQTFILRGLQDRNDDDVVKLGIMEEDRAYTYHKMNKHGEEIRIYIVNDNVEGISVMKKGFLEQCSTKIHDKWGDLIIKENTMNTVLGQTIYFKLKDSILDRIECSQFEFDDEGISTIGIREAYVTKKLEEAHE